MEVDIKKLARRERCRDALLADLHYVDSLVKEGDFNCYGLVATAIKDLKRSLKSYLESYV